MGWRWSRGKNNGRREGGERGEVGGGERKKGRRKPGQTNYTNFIDLSLP